MGDRYEKLKKCYVTPELIKLTDEYLKGTGYEFNHSTCDWNFYYDIMEYVGNYRFLPWWREKSAFVEGAKLAHSKIKHSKITK